jgi:hypothetical protein
MKKRISEMMHDKTNQDVDMVSETPEEKIEDESMLRPKKRFPKPEIALGGAAKGQEMAEDEQIGKIN